MEKMVKSKLRRQMAGCVAARRNLELSLSSAEAEKKSLQTRLDEQQTEINALKKERSSNDLRNRILEHELEEMILELFETKEKLIRTKVLVAANEPPSIVPQCAVCLNHIANVRLERCDHVFCRVCIERWMRSNKTCPLCREGFTYYIQLYKDVTGESQSSETVEP